MVPCAPIAIVLVLSASAADGAGRQAPAVAGFFTSEQARRGESTYAQYCIGCHGPALTGADEATALTGTRFVSNWNRRSVGDLFTRIRTTMPPGAPTPLTRRQTADVVAFVLRFNNVPTGSAELPLQAELLKQLPLVLAPAAP